MEKKDRRRFWEKVDRPNGAAECWLWMGSGTGTGYGQFWLNGTMVLAHRISYELAHGPIGRLCVLHRCDVRNCVNPAHLFIGTQQDNRIDAARKGRHPTKLSPSKVRWARRALRQGKTQRQVAKALGVSQMAIWSMAVGQTWEHVLSQD